MGRNWKDLIVWQRAHSLVLEIYKATASFPSEEKYSLVDQIRRCSYSIPANIVEGHSKSTSRDFLRYLYISRGSIEELKYFLLLSRDLNYINHEKYENLFNMTNETSYLLNQFIRSIKPQQP